MKKSPLCLSAGNYTKALARLQKSIRSGRFARYTQQKKQELWKRLCRYARQLGIQIKAPIAAACLAAGLSVAMPAAAQPTFIEQTGAANPLNGEDVGNMSHPAFADMDNDGDLDVFIGAYDGAIRYYLNTGTATVPFFVQQTGTDNPLDGVDTEYYSAPVFVDIDDDGDLDAFIGDFFGNVQYYLNTGTESVPVLTAQPGIANPLDGFSVGGDGKPSFVDIDGDGDLDVFLGSNPGPIKHYINTGTVSAPVFSEQTGAANPFNGLSINTNTVPAFFDIDGDSDMDVFLGQGDGTILYFENTGTAGVPVFTLRTGTDNPFNGVDVGNLSTLSFADIDADGYMDALIGSNGGTIANYENSMAITLPLHLLSFSGSMQPGYNQLQWQTADEVNTKSFEIERSSNGRNFTKIATVNAVGNSNNTYSINDNVVNTGKLFYRLKMVDIDARSTYSHVIWIETDKAAGVTVYPNPVKDVININSGNARIVKTLAHVYDASGRLLQTVLINYNQQQINVTPLSPGVYTIKFADGTARRFMKE